MHLHFCGIGGIGMSALARWHKALGHIVQGSDQNVSALTQALQDEGLTVFDTQSANHVSETIDVLVYTEAIPADHPERLRARDLGILEQSYFSALSELANQKRLIAVAGTHGKTTTTGIVASGLLQVNLDPTVVVGAGLPLLDGRNFHQGQSDWCIVEACEYRNNFKDLRPEVVILTNLELDHVDYFRDEAHYIKTFQAFISQAQLVIYHGDDQLSQQVVENFTGASIAVSDQDMAAVSGLRLAGEHNRRNAALGQVLGKYLAKDELNFDLTEWTEGLANFSGAGRRQEFLGELAVSGKSFEIYDDYGHHPTEISATLQAFREKYPEQTIGLVFQPHQHSRTRQFLDEFKVSLGEADETALLPIYAARDNEKDLEEISSSLLGFPVLQADQLRNWIGNLPDKSVVVFMGAGSISGIARALFERE